MASVALFRPSPGPGPGPLAALPLSLSPSRSPSPSLPLISSLQMSALSVLTSYLSISPFLSIALFFVLFTSKYDSQMNDKGQLSSRL